MKKLFLVTCLILAGSLSAQPTAFNVVEIKAKDFSEKTSRKPMKPVVQT